MHRLSTDVVPVGLGFIINEQQQAVVDSTGAEVVKFAVYDGSQTDSRMTDRSEGHQVGMPLQLSLSHMVVDHLGDQEGSLLTTPLEQQQLRLGSQLGLAERLAITDHPKAGKIVGTVEGRLGQGILHESSL